VYRRKDHDGTWALRGHRLRGLDVMLSTSLGGDGSLVFLRRNEEISPVVWEVQIDKRARLFIPRESPQTPSFLLASD
jgi:hypothetical protein